MTKEGEIYVCDRNNDRFQVFKKDGTFIKEVIVNKQSLGLGTVVDLAFSPDEKFIYVGDTTDAKVWILRKDNDQIVGTFGRQGRYAGQFVSGCWQKVSPSAFASAWILTPSALAAR